MEGGGSELRERESASGEPAFSKNSDREGGGNDKASTLGTWCYCIPVNLEKYFDSPF